MVNYGYGPGDRGWDESKAAELAGRLRILVLSMEQQKKFDNIHEWKRPYVEMDGLYAGVRIRKITHLDSKVCDELVEESEKIYHDVMGLPTLQQERAKRKKQKKK
jgi:hypothetical protein